MYYGMALGKESGADPQFGKRGEGVHQSSRYMELGGCKGILYMNF